MYLTVAEQRLIMLRNQLREAQQELAYARKLHTRKLCDAPGISTFEHRVCVALDRAYSAQSHVDNERLYKAAARQAAMEALS